MRNCLAGVTAAAVLAASANATAAHSDGREAVPDLDHVFVIVLENHNAFTSFGANGILDNPKAPHIQALADKYNVAANYISAWHPGLPNYVAMITGDLIVTDVVTTGHTYPAGSTVGISDDDSASVSTDYPSPPANVSHHPGAGQPAIDRRPAGRERAGPARLYAEHPSGRDDAGELAG